MTSARDLVAALAEERKPDLTPGEGLALLARAPDLGPAVEETLAFLGSEAARELLAADPYWPKWDSTWWRLLLLCELGLSERIPRGTALTFARRVAGHYLRIFPIYEGELPPGVDGPRGVLCFCAAGGVMTIALATGLDVPEVLPWIPAFVDRYRIADGGCNCDEEAYRREAPCSSIESTVAAAEPFLALEGDARVPFAAAVTDGAARYVLARAASRSLRKQGAPMFPGVTTPVFPRFYGYDAARGLRFVARWALRRGVRLDLEPLIATIRAVDAALYPSQPSAAPGDPAPRPFHALAGTRRRHASGEWVREPRAGTCPLLEVASRPEIALARLRAEWAGTLGDIAAATA